MSAGPHSWVGKLPVSFPRDVGTAPAFYNYLKGARPLDPGSVLDDGTLVFGHQVGRLFIHHCYVANTIVVCAQQSCAVVGLWAWP